MTGSFSIEIVGNGVPDGYQVHTDLPTFAGTGWGDICESMTRHGAEEAAHALRAVVCCMTGDTVTIAGCGCEGVHA